VPASWSEARSSAVTLAPSASTNST
jgi:hypothetical protein